MAKKGQIINNYHIDELDVEAKIDYKKLAKEIVLAQEEAKRLTKRPNRIRASVMTVVNMILPVSLALFSVLACIGMWIDYATAATFGILDCIAYSVMFLAILLISVLYSIETWRDDDENAIMHFNTNVALVALIVSLIALVKG